MHRAGKHLCLVGMVAAGLAVVAGCPLGRANLPINVAKGLQAEYVVTGLARPFALAFLPDGRVLYTEKNTGRIRVIVDGELLDEPFATVPVNYAGDRGLLGIAVHPRFELNSRVYVFYTRSDTGAATDDPQATVDHRIVYFVADGDVASGGEVFVASIPVEGTGAQVGGHLAFWGDDTLLAAVGDMTHAAGVQDDSALVGKVLRYNDDGSIPVSNPIAGSPVFARGFRDPQGLTYDPESRTVFLTDRNQNRYHEVNRVFDGRDYGWPSVSGFADTADERAYAAANPDYMDPLLDSGTNTSPLVGATFNPSGKYGTRYRMRFFYGQRNRGQIYNVELSADRGTAVAANWFAGRLPTPLNSICFSPSGTLYALTNSAILRIEVFE